MAVFELVVPLLLLFFLRSDVMQPASEDEPKGGESR